MKKMTTSLLLMLTACLGFSQSDSTPFTIESKFFKFQFYDKGKFIDSVKSENIREVLKEVEAELQDLEQELEAEGKLKPDQESALPKPPKLVETKGFVMDLGFNNWIHEGALELPEDYRQMQIDKLRSVNFHLGIVQQGINLYQGKLRLVYGLGIEFNNYRFTENIDLQKGSNPLSFVENKDLEYKKNKLVTQYATIPLMLHFKSNPADSDESLRLSAGIQLGYLIGAHTKQKWYEGKNTEKLKVRGDYQLEDYRLGYVVQFGYGEFNLYGKFYPTQAFKFKRGPEVSTAAVGIVLTPF